MGEDEPMFGPGVDRVTDYQLGNYLDERGMWPVLKAVGRRGLQQVIVAEEDETLTLLIQGEGDFPTDYNVRRDYIFGALFRRDGLWYRQAYGQGILDAQRGDKLLLVNKFDTEKRFRSSPLTEVNPGIQYLYENLSQQQRQMWLNLLCERPEA